MWLYLPKAVSVCSRASEPSISVSEASSPDAAPWLTWRGKPMQRPSSQPGWRRATWTTLLSGLTSGHSQQTLSEAVSTWWQEAFPARTSAWPASEPALTASDPDSTSTSSASFATYDPATCSWRTLQPSLLDELSMPFSERWPKAGSMRSGAVCARPMLARHIAATGGGASPGTESSWPTITVGDSESGQTAPNPNRQGGAAHESLRVAASNWPTPSSMTFSGGEPTLTDAMGARTRKQGPNLFESAARWPTPTRLDSTNTANRTATRSDPDSKHHDGVTLVDASRMWPTPHGFNGQDTDGGYGTGGEFEKYCKLWATPRSADYRSGEVSDRVFDKNARPLTEQVARWEQTLPAWVPCPCCEDFLCTIHQMHAHDCECPGIEEWETDPYTAGPDSRPNPTTATAGEPSSSSTPTSRRQLNPRFVEVLMGLPPGWTCVCAHA